MTTRNDTGPQGYCGFEVGQHVVCIDDSGGSVGLEGTMQLVKGTVYTIHAIDADSFEAVAVQVAECDKTYMADGEEWEGWFGYWRFRPLPKLRVEDFLAASTPKDVVSA